MYCFPVSSCVGRSLREMCTTGFFHDIGGRSHNCKYIQWSNCNYNLLTMYTLHIVISTYYIHPCFYAYNNYILFWFQYWSSPALEQSSAYVLQTCSRSALIHPLTCSTIQTLILQPCYTCTTWWWISDCTCVCSIARRSSVTAIVTQT